jgi:hypothetical protein
LDTKNLERDRDCINCNKKNDKETKWNVAAVILLFTTCPEVWSQAANATTCTGQCAAELQAMESQAKSEAYVKEIVNKAIPLFGIDLPLGKESPTFIQNVTQLAKEGFDSSENAKLFLQLDSIALNSSSSRPGNVTFTTPTINCCTSRHG